MYKEIDGDLFKLADEFDIIAQGCNCFCKQEKGIAKEFVEKYGTDSFDLEDEMYKGDINKLGCIDWNENWQSIEKCLIVINCYTQYDYKKKYEPDEIRHLDYAALRLCLKKINHTFKGKRIGLPKIGAGLAGGNWDIIKLLIKTELKDCDVTIVNYKI